MKTYTQLLSTLLILILIVGCSPKREMVPNLGEMVEYFRVSGNPIMVSGNPFTGILYSEHTNGQIRVEIRVKKGIPNGVFETYYDDGQLRLKGTYKDGELDGLREEYHENGQLFERRTYKDGIPNGVFETYYDDGQLWEKRTYKDGKLDGLWESYHNNGQLKEKRTFKDGELDGQMEEYYNNGQLKEKRTYKDGQLDGLFEQFDSNGQLLVEGIYERGEVVGEWKIYDILGNQIETDVYNPVTRRIWMDRNLGASRVATSSTDRQAYGDLYQWGRGADGHQRRNSQTTSNRSSREQPGHGSFIRSPNTPYDWRSPQNNNLWQGVNGINNPCPEGYRIPTEAEWNAERASWSRGNSTGAFASHLKLPVAGGRDHSSGSLFNVGRVGYYWSGSVDGTSARLLYFNSINANMDSDYRMNGYSVRCIRD
jgi:uncharacterized protein (TIGR02145 family)